MQDQLTAVTALDAPSDDRSSAKALEAAALLGQRRRRALVVALRVAILVVDVGSWEFAGRRKWIDPFFFGLPSGIARQIVEWCTEGTSQGPLWIQVLVTFEETAIGFVIGAVACVVCGIALGRNRFLADVFSIYIKVANSIPRRRRPREALSHRAENTTRCRTDRELQTHRQPGRQAFVRIEPPIRQITRDQHGGTRQQAGSQRQQQGEPAGQLRQHSPDQRSPCQPARAQRRSPMDAAEKRHDRRRIGGQREPDVRRCDRVTQGPRGHGAGNERQQPGDAEDTGPGRR